MTDGTLTMGQYLAAKRHKAKGYTFKTVAFKIGATEKQVRNALEAPTSMPRKPPGRQPKAKAKPYHASASADEPFGRVAAGIGETVAVKVPREVLQERDRRMAMSPPSLTAALLGDPLPGRSALDKRQGA